MIPSLTLREHLCRNIVLGTVSPPAAGISVGAHNGLSTTPVLLIINT